ncbi:type II toxin-antitoxin system VapC family toxin [Methanocalculus taiwanensis]|uniref:Type II toxin-antitoxin system VapC family toxin n=1 Tax=Methanocalculus taiwanensis TaxID=106207 RepID=A0ABD4TGS2_9EURY|nr:type II toxin-antitoxin system VapC family toxin [Methanocalculus taiwanensis]MCQ1538167.1 type II toxin-antitoxin system VapC family toxin [Methanocalculus taiwanensis]
MKVMVDSNILIFANIADMPEYPLARERLLTLIDQGCTFVVNTIIISEVQYKLQRLLNNEQSHSRTIKILKSRYFDYYPIEKTTVMSAVDLSHVSNVRINDALIAQHCLDLRLDGIITDNVKDFKRIPNLHRIHLREGTV